jgi:phage tail P2-like protein
MNDAGMKPIVEVLAETMVNLFGNCSYPTIFSRIDELPESLLDILAKDFKIEWYDYNWGIEAKRMTIRDSFYVHRHLGTVGAVKRALTDVWSPSTVEEWFEYGGDPYYFRAILDASNSAEPIRVGSALDAIMFYKSARSHLESNVPIVRVSFGIVIKTAKDNVIYHVRSCGTVPRVATHGNRSLAAIDIETDSPTVPYHSPLTGQLTAGTHPTVSTHGNADDGGLSVSASSFGSTYTARPCGTSFNSLA